MLFHGLNSLKAPGTYARGLLLLLCIGGHEPTAGDCSDARQHLEVLIVLIALFAVTRLLRYYQDTQRICADDPSASVCGR